MRCRIAIYILVMGLLILLGSVYYYGSSQAFSERFRGIVENYLSSATGMEVEVRSVSLVPLPFTVEIRGISVKDKKTHKEVLRLGTLRAYLRIRPLLYKRIEARVLELEALRVSSWGLSMVGGLLSGPGVQEKVFKVDTLTVRSSFLQYNDATLSVKVKVSRVDYSFRASEVSFSGRIIDLRYKTLSLKDMDVRGVLRPLSQRIGIKNLFLKKKGTELSLKGDIVPESLRVAVQVRGRLPAEDLLGAINIHLPITGRLQVHGVVSGTLETPVLRGRIKMADGKVYGVVVDELESTLKVSPEIVRFSDIKARAYGGDIRGGLYLNLPYDGFTLMLQAVGVRSKALLTLLSLRQIQIPEGRVELVLIQSGREFNPRGHFRYTSSGEPASVWDDITEAEAYFWSRKGLVHLDRGSIFWDHATFRGVRGWLDLVDSRIYLKGRAEVRDLKRLGPPLDGRFRGEATLDGPISGPRIFLNGTIKGTGLKDIVLGDIDLRGCISNRCLVLEAPGRQNLFLQGLFRKDLVHLAGRVKGLPLEGLLPGLKGLKGRVSGNVLIDGSPEDLRGKIELDLDNISYRGILFGKARTDIVFDNKGVNFRDLVLRNGGSELRGTFSIKKGIINTKKLDFDILPKDFGLLRSLPLELKGSVEGTGSLHSPLIKARADVLFQGRKVGIAYMDIAGSRLSLKARGFHGNIDILADTELKNPYPWQMELTLRKADYGEVLRGLYSLPEGFSVITKGHISARGSSGRSTARGTLETLEVRFRDKRLHNDGTVVFEYDGQWLRLGGLQLVGESVDITLMGRITPDLSEANLSVFGNIEMPFLNGIAKGITFPSGRARFSLSLNGPVKRSALSGGVNIDRAEVMVPGMDEGIKIDGGQVYLEGRRFHIRDIHGTMMNGFFRITGEGMLKEDISPSDYSIKAELRSFIYSPEPDISLRFDGELYVLSTIEGPSLSGRIYVVDGLITKNLTFKDMLSSKPNVSVPEKKGPLSGIRLNLSVDVPETVRVENNLLEATVKGSFNIVGSPGAIGAVGRIEFKDGYLFFRGNRFSIVHGRVSLSSPDLIRPYIDFMGQTEIKQYTVKISMSGYPDSLEFTLFSEPYLDRTDILSLLTFGTLAERTRGLEGEIGATEATLFLTGQLQETLQERLRTLTGIDRIDIEPYIDKTGSISPRITFYKRLLTDRVSVVYTTTTSEQTKDTVDVVFKLSNTISLVGERDEDGFLGGDIRLRLKFR